MKRLNSESGFTLLEVIIAMAIVAIVASAILNFFVTGTRTSRLAKDKDAASLIAGRIYETERLAPEVSEGVKIRYFAVSGDEVTDASIAYYKSEMTLKGTDGGNQGAGNDFTNAISMASPDGAVEVTGSEGTYICNGVSGKADGDVINVIIDYGSTTSEVVTEVKNSTADLTQKTVRVIILNDPDNLVKIVPLAGEISYSRGWTSEMLSSEADYNSEYAVSITIERIHDGRELLSENYSFFDNK